MEVEIEDALTWQYPHLDRKLLLTPSLPYAPIIRSLKLAEYSRGENDDFIYMFCGGNKLLADENQNKLPIEEEVKMRENIREVQINKGYFTIGRPNIKLLDDILTIDNTLESWLWRSSLATASLFHIYNLMQESVNPSDSFVKTDGYTFDLKVIREKF